MKKFYILFFALPVLAFTMLYLGVWWFIGGLAILLIFLAYRFYTVKLDASVGRNEVLQNELDEMHIRLEKAVIKEQKTNKEAEQIRQLKQQLLSVISHEVRTPMNGVLGMTLLLEDTSLNKEQKEYVDTIRNCGESLLATINNMLVNDILDFSKLQLEGKQIEYKDFDLRDSIEEVLEMFAEKAGRAGIDLIYEIGSNVPEQLVGDSKRMRQVLMNLVENAMKFTRKGEIFVGVGYTIHTTTGRPPELNFEIRDTGIGIESAQLKQLFKGIPGREVQKDGEEAGLGLVICKKLVELMGGSIAVTSQPGTGTSFTFHIPLTPGIKTARDHARRNEMSNMEGKQVLITDDNATSRATLLKQLKSWKMQPVTAASGKEALELLEKNKYDLVLTDINMPAMDGIQLAKSIRDLYPAIPLIGLDNAGDEKHKQETTLFSSIITKPVRQAILRDKLLDVFHQKTIDMQTTSTPMSDLFAAKYPLRILVAEDNTVNQKIAMKILSKFGYEAALANNGKEVMEMVSHDHYDIILMDVQMPEMDGLEATRMIRTCLEIQPVIIALTANAMQGDRDECMQAGMDDYLSKPIEMAALLSQLEKWALSIKSRRKLSA